MGKKKNEIAKTNHDANIKSDYEYSRDTYYDLIEAGKDALEEMVEVARSSEHPRAFEVLSGMIKNIADVNDRLMDLNKKSRDLSQDNGDSGKKEVTNNNVFVGSTAELQKFLDSQKAEKIINNKDESE